MTDREIHILGGLSRDLSNKAIARELGLSNETVKWYIAKMLAKLGAQDRHQAVDRARAFGVLPMFQAKAWSNIMFTPGGPTRSEEHTSELQSLMRISYADFCVTKKKMYNSDNSN